MDTTISNTVKDIKVELSKTRSLLIVLPELITIDTAVAALLLVELLTKSLNKPAKIILPEDYNLSNRVSEFAGFTHFEKDICASEVTPLRYTLSLPNVGENTEVEWKLENEVLEIMLKPNGKKVDISKLDFKTEGERYDALITLGAQTKEMLNSAYLANATATKDIPHINMDCHPLNEKFGNINVVNTKASTVTEVVYELYKELGAKMEKDSADLAKKTVIVSTDGIRRIASSETLQRLIELEKLAENNVGEVVKTHYHSLGKKGLALREMLLKNSKLEHDSKVLWAHISREELKSLEIDVSVLDGIEQLPYNICKDVEVAVLLYQEEAKWTAVAISNTRKRSVFKWAKSLGGKATSSIGVVNFEGELDTISVTMLNSLKTEIFAESELELAIEEVIAEEIVEEEDDASPFTKASDEELAALIEKRKEEKGLSDMVSKTQMSPFEKDEQFK